MKSVREASKRKREWMMVKEVKDGFVKEMEKLEWWFEQDINDGGEKEEEDEGSASKTFWMWIFLWKETRLRQLMSSRGAPSAGPLTPLSYSSGPSTPPSYSSGPSTPPNYSLGSSRNAKYSNCKHLRGKISVLKATMNMHMHPEQHTVNSAALLHEVLNEIEKLNLE
nr:hypothetical protein [Tanacetum cinerariifolium]